MRRGREKKGLMEGVRPIKMWQRRGGSRLNGMAAFRASLWLNAQRRSCGGSFFFPSPWPLLCLPWCFAGVGGVLSKQEQNDQRAAAAGEFLDEVPSLMDIYCSQRLRPFELEFLPVLRRFALSRTEILQPHNSQFQTCTWSINKPAVGMCQRRKNTVVQAWYVNLVHLSQEYVQQREIKPDKTPFYTVLFSVTKPAAKIDVCVRIAASPWQQGLLGIAKHAAAGQDPHGWIFYDLIEPNWLSC